MSFVEVKIDSPKLYKPLTCFAVAETESPDLYKLPTRFAEVSPNLHNPPTRLELVKTDSPNLYKYRTSICGKQNALSKALKVFDQLSTS